MRPSIEKYRPPESTSVRLEITCRINFRFVKSIFELSLSISNSSADPLYRTFNPSDLADLSGASGRLLSMPKLTCFRSLLNVSSAFKSFVFAITFFGCCFDLSRFRSTVFANIFIGKKAKLAVNLVASVHNSPVRFVSFSFSLLLFLSSPLLLVSLTLMDLFSCFVFFFDFTLHCFARSFLSTSSFAIVLRRSIAFDARHRVTSAASFRPLRLSSRCFFWYHSPEFIR